MRFRMGATKVSFMVRSTEPVVIVTGGSRGPGREIAGKLGTRDYSVVVVYLSDQAEAEATVEEILAADGTALAIRADACDELDVERLFSETAAAFGGVDVVVHTAGRSASIVNRHAARRLRHGGAIVNISSSDVVATALAAELRSRDITVNGLAPGVEPPGADHDVAELLRILDRWRSSRGD